MSQGDEATKMQKAPGRSPKLDETAKAKLIETLKLGAIVAGFPTEQWTQARVRAVIKRDYGVSYHKNHISRLLHDLGWSVQKPETRALERDEELILAWLKKDWPAIKKAKKQGAEIVFEDEFGVSYVEAVSFTWAPVGETPILKRHGRYRRETSTMASLTLSGKIYKRHFDGSSNSEKIVEGLKHLRQHIQGPFILIWDQSRTHKSLLVKDYLKKHPDIQVEYLPAYAPELNPEEYCHGNVKRRMKNAVFHSKAEIRKSLDYGFARLRKRPDILFAFFQYAGLDINQLM